MTLCYTVIDTMEMELLAARTPLKARNQEFTPALGNVELLWHV